jgi:hypothetical protein
VDDFAVKYVGKQHAEHLRNALLKTYELTTDWAGTVNSGMTLKWDYKNRTCDISMPGYVSNLLSKFQHDAPKHPQHTPSWYGMPVYGANTQYATKYETPPRTAQQCLTIQKVPGSILYYTRAVDPTVLMPLNDIATDQTKETEKMLWCSFDLKGEVIILIVNHEVVNIMSPIGSLVIVYN